MHTDPAPGDPLFTPFSPTPSQRSSIYRAMSDVNQTVFSIAVEHGVPLESLVAWLATTQVQHQLHAFEVIAAQHARMCAMLQAPYALNALHELTQACTREETRSEITEAGTSSLARDRRRSTFLRGIALIHKFARLSPPTTRRTPNPSSQTTAPIPLTDATPDPSLPPAPTPRLSRTPNTNKKPGPLPG